MRGLGQGTKKLALVAIGLFVAMFTANWFPITSIFAEQDNKVGKSAAEQFRDATKYANSLRGSIKSDGDNIAVANLEFKFTEVFNKQKGGYTKSPPQIGYMDNVDSMQKSATSELAKDTEYKDSKGNTVASPGKAVFDNFQSRPIYKITKDDEYVAKSNFVKEQADSIVKGSSNDDIDCESESINHSDCETTYIERSCNEEIRAVRRVCEKNPHITIKEEIYPGCQVRIHPTGKEECLIGTFGIGTHRKMVPKHLASRVEVAGSRHGYFYVTVINETTGEVLYKHTRMNNGVAFDLTFSDTQDQTFRLVADRADGCNCHLPGHLTMYIDRKYRSANVDWKVENCRDI